MIWKAVVVSRYERKISEHVFATVMPLVVLSSALDKEQESVAFRLHKNVIL
ncbi:hypothetical protein [Photobacterium leiognathi]|uniref:hypothetical protein n=1 Tax=Photobacterium leiognathi TaxID=553611 RepID=UPI003AF3B27D